MTTRLVCHSAPLPTKEIARRMAEDERDEESRSVRRYVRQHPTRGGRIPTAMRVARVAIANPEDTDVGQCWSEEVFSMLEGER